MKRILAAFIAVVMSAGAALAAPETPVFNEPVNIGQGAINNQLNKRMVFSGSTVYVGYGGAEGDLRVVKSDDGGMTWGVPYVLQTPDSGVSPDAAGLRLAISNDPLYSGKKIVHAVWPVSDPARIIINYSYNTNRPEQNGWSKPFRIDLGAIAETAGAAGTSLAVTSSGAVHILHSMKYVTAASFESSFSSPVSLYEPGNGTAYMGMDENNNLYASYVVGNRQLRMVKKAASYAEWSLPSTVYETDHDGLSNNHELIALNPTTYYLGIYISYAGKGEASLLTTTDGGSTWSRKSIYANEIDGDNCINVAVSSAKTISFASEIYDSQGNSVIRVWRSSDNGATWSKPANVKGEKLPNIALDSSGKLNILVMDETKDFKNSKLLWIKEK